MKTTLFSTLIAIAIVFSACSGEKKEQESSETPKTEEAKDHVSGSTAPEQATNPTFEVDGTFKSQLEGVFTAYVAMKEAFVATDAQKVKDEAAKTSAALAKVDMKLLTGAAHNDWMTYVGAMDKSLKEISSASDVEAQRTAFSTVSDNLYKSIKAFGLAGDEAFYEYCPMAFNNEGAYWLSDNEQIRNPYFGDKMLTCGQVVEKLQ